MFKKKAKRMISLNTIKNLTKFAEKHFDKKKNNVF
jgi:hypothetical protein